MKLLLSMFLLSWTLLGCQSKVPMYMEDKPTLPTAVAGASDAAIVGMTKKLTSKGVQIISMGDAYMLSVPVPLVFAEQSPKIKWQSYDLLNDVVCYLQLFRKITVQVNAYGSCYVSKERVRALTLARAKAVGNYLWTHNIETRIVFTEGLGDAKPIVAVAKCSDQSPNARIEIIFKQMVA